MFLVYILSILMSLNDQPFENQITIHIENIKKVKGTIYVAIYDNAEDFPEDGRWLWQEKKAVKSQLVTFSLDNMPVMDCAIAVYHDVNDNSTMDTNWLGIPKEPYGFSKNFIPKFRAPRFDECLLSSDDWKQSITIKLTD